MLEKLLRKSKSFLLLIVEKLAENLLLELFKFLLMLYFLVK
jgi:hypothetical protein